MDISRRIGQFTLPATLIFSEPSLVMSEIMARCIVTYAELRSDHIRYVAMSPDFDEIERGGTPVEYDVEIIGPNARFVKRTT